MPPADETVLPTPGTEQGQGVFFFDIGVLGYASVYDVYIVFFGSSSFTTYGEKSVLIKVQDLV